MRIAGSEAFEATAFAPDAAQGLPPTGAMSPFPAAPAPPAPPAFGAPAAQPGFGAPPAQPGFGGPYGAPPAPEASPYASADVDAVASTGVAGGPAAARELRAFLYSFHNESGGAFWPIYSGSTSIGRAGSGEQLDIEINDPTTSSRHCVFTSDGPGRVTLQDTGSTNGTFVNDQAIGYQGTSELRDGDRIRLGGYNASIRFANR